MIARASLAVLLTGATISVAVAAPPGQSRRALRRPAAVMPAVGVVAPAPVRGVYLLKEGTDVTVTNRTELSSKTAHVGDRFDIEVAEAVKVGSATVIPAGTIGATVVAGPFGLLVKGKSAIIEPGTQMHVFIKENTSLVGQ